MKIETLQDVLHWAQAYHRQMQQCLVHCSDENESERVRMLLDYLSGHEKKLARALERFEEQADGRALHTLCNEYMDKQPILRHETCTAPLAEMTSDEVIRDVVHQHDQIMALYQHLRSRLPAGHAEEFLAELEDLENHEAMQMVKHYQQLEDL